MMTKQTPLMRQYMGIKKNYPDCLLFFRMGDFYEMFYDDAKVASKVLNVALTSRNKTKNEPMCGVPYHALATYLERAVKGGHKVAICEQVEDPKVAQGIVRREVIRVVTPGTLTEDYLLDERENNYLASVSCNANSAGLAFIDLSCGSFCVTQFVGDKYLPKLIDELARLSPKEVILPEGDSHSKIHQRLKAEGFHLEQLDPYYFEEKEATKVLLEQLSTATLEGFGLAGKTSAISAGGSAISYIKTNRPEALEALEQLSYIPQGGNMEIDSASIKNLELLSNLADGGKEGTLIEVLDQTKTAVGARLLRERLVKPLTSKEEIVKRLSLVTSFFENYEARDDLRSTLSQVSDFERAIGRIAGKTFAPRDFSSLAISLFHLPQIYKSAKLAGTDSVNQLLKEWDDVAELSSFLESAINPSHPATFKDTGFIKDGFDEELDEIRSFLKNITATIKDMEESEREKTGISTLKFGFNRIYGYYIEITKKNADLAPDNYIRKQSLVNCERFVSPELKEIEEKLSTASEQEKIIETRLIDEVRLETIKYLSRVRKSAGNVAQLDVASTLADVAKTNNYCLPEMTGSNELTLKESRHPVIERLMVEENFVPNDIEMSEESPHLLILTGPNMAGKSTYLRQTALAILMAQVGSYISADSGVIGIADNIYTRVGAHDRLQKGLSTFMVEMVETANILNNATERSFIILDEIGRGTSTFDGVSIAWAVAEFLARLKSRTLFATHYHELTDLSATQEGVVNFNVSAREYKESLIFMRKIEKGPADKSYGIQVARLAGLPDKVLKSAKRVLAELEKMEFDVDGKPALKAEEAKDDKQGSLFDARHHPIIDSLRSADIDNMTPVDALNLVNELRKLL